MSNRFFILLAVLLLTDCSNTNTEFGELNGRITGRAVKGTIAGADVVVTAALTGTEVARGTTDENGAFSITMGTELGDYRVCVTGGGYVEEATGTRVELEANEICAPLEAFGIAEEREVFITPWTHLVEARAEALLRLRGVEFAEASSQARTEIDAFLTCSNRDLSVINADPLDPTSGGVGGLELTSSLLSGLLLGGLSQQAKMISEKPSLTPGVSATSLSLTLAFAEDLWADGGLDGNGLDGRLELKGHLLGPDSIRGAQEGFAQGVRSFLLSPQNQTSITPADLQALLACIATAEGDLFPDRAGGTLDVEGPALSFVAPAEGARVAGSVAVQVEADDLSDIDDIWLEDGPGLSVQVPTIDGRHGQVTAILDTTDLPDGPCVLRAFAVDVLTNSSEASIEVDINNEAPVITIEAPSDTPVSGADVVVRATATDPQGVASLAIVTPALDDTNPATDVFEATWDTTAVIDGTTVLEFSAVDSEANSSTASLVTTVDNLSPGTISVQAFMDTPVEDITIQVLALQADGSRGAVLATNQGGAYGSVFAGTLPDTYAGPILVRGFGTSAHYTNAATGQPVSFAAGDELLLITTYVPTPAGTDLADLSLDALTTLGAHAALARWRDGMLPAQAIDAGNSLVAEHLERTGSLDILTTPASDFTFDPIADALASQKVGLVHAGLSQLGVQWAQEASLPATALPSIAVMRHLATDLEVDGVLDGTDGVGASVAVTDVRNLETDTLRSHAALAIVDWLEGTQNQSSLEPGNFTQTGGMLDLMASDMSELFGPEPTQGFDIFGPSLVLVQPSDGDAVTGTVTVQATAADPSGVSLILGYIDYQVSSALGVDQDASETGFTATLDTTQLADGPHNLRLVSVDTRDNIAIHDFAFTADNSPPEITLQGPGATGSTAVTVTGSLGDAHSGVATLEVWADGSPPDVVNDPGTTFNRMVAVPCNAETRITARAVNAVGLAAEATVTVACDDRPPGLALLTSTYVPTSRMEVTYDSANETLRYDRRPGEQPVSLNDLDWASPGPTLEKFFTRLDRIPFSGVTRVNNNLPYLAISPDDFAQAGTQVGSTPDTMLVSYRYFFQGTMKRDWTDLSFSTSDEAFLLAFSYQDLGTDLADATGTEEHRIDIRMVDPQGNATVETVFFRMQATSPPIVYADCDLGYLEDKTLANDRLHEWFSFDNPSFFSGKLVFPHLPENSLAPWTYELRIPTVAVTFAETQRAQHRTISRYVPCADYTGDWCSVANDAAGADNTCWVQEDGKEMHRYISGAAVNGHAAICNEGFWPDGPATSVPVALSSGTFPGVVDGVPATWPYDSVGETWDVPIADYLASPWNQALVFRLRTTAVRPVLSTPDLEGTMWLGTPKHGGGWGYLIRSHSGYELVRKWGPAAGIDYHWSRAFEADEYIDQLQVAVPAIVPEISITALGDIPILPFGGACGVDLINQQRE